jgi:hypothetical protein
MRRLVLFWIAWQVAAFSQEASSGFELRSTVSGLAAYTPDLTDAPRNGNAVAAGVRAMLYPEWKINANWSISGAVQIHTRPYFYQEFWTQGYGALANVIRAEITYARVRGNRSLVLRTGVLPVAFGSFPLRYDDAVNPLIHAPLSYGYYGSGISLNGFAGAEVDAAAGKVDARMQFLNSSPENRRSIFDHDQYGAWVGGAGFTLAQGFRIGASAFRGAYLDRTWPYYFPGEANPRDLPGTGMGLDVQWGRGPWNAWGELQRFILTYRVIPTFREDAGYAELRRSLGPRWYAASRFGYLRSTAAPTTHMFESAIGYRPTTWQLLKFGYALEHGLTNRVWSSVCGIQYVVVLPSLSIARR